MTSRKSPHTLERISPDTIRQATGRDWDEWLAVLDEAGAIDWDHRKIVAHLEERFPDLSSGWWRQSITVGYEKARGKRVEGQTAGGTFEVGVRRTVEMSVANVWELITSRPELWLGEGASIVFRPREKYRVEGGAGAPAASGEIRVVKPGQRLRMTWRPGGWESPATLQINVTATSAGRTAVQVHLEKLPDADAREVMRSHWREILERLAAAAS